ncbi:MAG: sugar phosphate nucleotidyltransferase [Faecousia sp.]
MKTTLLIMAAGIGSRFGGGIKQLEPVGLNDEIIMDYSVHDAIEAGFNKIIFVIRKDIEADFRQRIGDRIQRLCDRLGVEVGYAFQDLQAIPQGFSLPEGRVKPWGTGQAVLAAKDMLREPFMVINADDYYGKHAYSMLHSWLMQDHEDTAIAMVGFSLKNTLSENGGVTRGLCKVLPPHSHVVDVVETRNIVKTPRGAEADGVALDLETLVSMNMWGFPAGPDGVPRFLEVLEQNFEVFFREEVRANPLKSEYLLPTLIGGMLRKKQCTLKVLPSTDKWFGVTYKEDKATVVESFRELIESGVYQKDLYSDLFS